MANFNPRGESGGTKDTYINIRVDRATKEKLMAIAKEHYRSLTGQMLLVIKQYFQQGGSRGNKRKHRQDSCP